MVDLPKRAQQFLLRTRSDVIASSVYNSRRAPSSSTSAPSILAYQTEQFISRIGGERVWALDSLSQTKDLDRVDFTSTEEANEEIDQDGLDELNGDLGDLDAAETHGVDDDGIYDLDEVLAEL